MPPLQRGMGKSRWVEGGEEGGEEGLQAVGNFWERAGSFLLGFTAPWTARSFKAEQRPSALAKVQLYEYTAKYTQRYTTSRHPVQSHVEGQVGGQ